MQTHVNGWEPAVTGFHVYGVSDSPDQLGKQLLVRLDVDGAVRQRDPLHQQHRVQDVARPEEVGDLGGHQVAGAVQTDQVHHAHRHRWRRTYQSDTAHTVQNSQSTVHSPVHSRL